MLGVRIPGIGVDRADVQPDPEGNVGPGGGMSVAPTWYKLPLHRIPKRLKDKMPREVSRSPTGTPARCIWWMGEGPFVDGELASGLRLRRTSETHGQVEPARVMPLEKFSAQLAKTRNAWRPIPEDPLSPEEVYKKYGQEKR